MINDKAYEIAAQKLGLRKGEVKRVFEEFCNICSDEYRANEDFCISLPKLGKIYKRKRKNGENKHKEDTSIVHKDSDDNGHSQNQADQS